jgi:hypothetical protein
LVFGDGACHRSIDIRARHTFVIDYGTDHHRGISDVRRKIAFMADTDELIGEP